LPVSRRFAYLVSIASISGIPKCSRAGPSHAIRGRLPRPLNRDVRVRWLEPRMARLTSFVRGRSARI
jgi:hypothetical protein